MATMLHKQEDIKPTLKSRREEVIALWPL